MPVINEAMLKKDISSGVFAPVYILFGDDSYLKKHYSDILIKKTVSEDDFFNFRHFEREVDLQLFYDSVNQLPVMAEKKCIFVDDYDFEHDDKASFDSVCEITASAEESCLLVFKFDALEFDVRKNAKAKKLLAAAEKCGGKAVELSHRTIGELKAMLIRGAEKRGCRMQNSVSGYIIESVGEDINTLQNELLKLCEFSDGGEITKETVDTVCAKTVEASVYDYVRDIIGCNISSALKSLDAMFYNRIEPIMILSAASSSFVDIYRCFCAGNTLNSSVIANDFNYGGRSFLVDKAKQNARKFDASKLKKCLDALFEADMMLKSFSFDERTLLEELTVKLGVIIATGGDGVD